MTEKKPIDIDEILDPLEKMGFEHSAKSVRELQNKLGVTFDNGVAKITQTQFSELIFESVWAYNEYLRSAKRVLTEHDSIAEMLLELWGDEVAPRNRTADH